MMKHTIFLQNILFNFESDGIQSESPVVKWLSPLTLNQLSSVRIRAGEFFMQVDLLPPWKQDSLPQSTKFFDHD